ncbi:hypothetical protein VEL36_004184 [Cronobacter sakazakii]|nr:hypothetical protein [Cronobacter sakazakii]
MNTAKLKAAAEKAKDDFLPNVTISTRDVLELIAALEAAEKRNAELEARTVTLPRPACTYADHSYPAYSEKQVVELLESLGINLETGGE